MTKNPPIDRLAEARARLRDGDVSCLLTDIVEITSALDRLMPEFPMPPIPCPATKVEGVPDRHAGRRGHRAPVIQRFDGVGWSERSKRPFRVVCCCCGREHIMVLVAGKCGWIGVAAKRSGRNRQNKVVRGRPRG